MTKPRVTIFLLTFVLPFPSSAHAQYDVERLVTGLDQPLFLTTAPNDDDRLFVVEKTGDIEIVDRITGQKNVTPFLDVGNEITTNSERGLLGLAFHPDYESNGLFYVNLTNGSGNTEIRQYQVSGDPDLADPASMSLVISINQPFANHNGGWIGFGPDGFLYGAMGDGGSGHDPENAGQRLNTLLGKMVRIDINADGFQDPARNYAIPADNPFAGDNDSSSLDEIWAYGLRNPWRSSFDSVTGDLYIGDVGQRTREELNFQHADSAGGENYGWRLREGTISTPSGGVGGSAPADRVDPVYDYVHGSGGNRGSVTGGYVYRGPITELYGQYVFADYLWNRIFSITVDRDSGVMVEGSLNELTSDFRPDAGSISSIVSFGEDNQGNLYVLDIGGEVFAVLPEFIPGDADRDGDVDSADRTIQAQNYTGPLMPGEGDKTFAEGDTDSDGDVDTADSTNLVRNWTGAQLASLAVLAGSFPAGGFDVSPEVDDLVFADGRMVQPAATFVSDVTAVAPVGTRAVAFAAQTVPEPTSITILMLGMLWLIVCRADGVSCRRL